MDMSDQNISYMGDKEETAQLEAICENVQELYLSKNKITDWNEVGLLFECFKSLGNSLLF